MHFTAAAEMTPSGVPPMPHRRSTGRSWLTATRTALTSPSEMSRTRAPASRMAAMPSSWRGRSSTIDHHVAGGAAAPLGDEADRLADRAVEVEQVGDVRAAGELLHVDARARVEHRAARRERDDRQRVRHALGRQRRALERVDRDVDLGRGAVADALAVGEHRRLVLLALADHDDAVHPDAAQDVVHPVDRGLVGSDLVAHAHEARSRQRGGLRGAHELEGEVAVRSAGRGGAIGVASLCVPGARSEPARACGRRAATSCPAACAAARSPRSAGRR